MIDSTFTAMNNAAMAEFGIIYDMMKRENEISMLESETELHRFQKRVQLYTFIMTALIILIILYLVFSRLKKVARMKKDMAHQLNQRDRELTSNALNLIKRNEVMKGVSEKLKKSKLKLKPENQTLVQEVINEINLELSEVGWKEFELRFLKVHPDFYHNIRQEFPDITPAEIKLSALLRLNFTTKEVASITGLSNSSVETARVRLRKKLKLDSDTNLVGFLSRF